MIKIIVEQCMGDIPEHVSTNLVLIEIASNIKLEKKEKTKNTSL